MCSQDQARPALSGPARRAGPALSSAMTKTMMPKATEQAKDGAAANQIVVLGLNHKWAPLVLREALAFPQHDLGAGLESIRRYVPEGAILSTCHRVELYAAAPNAARASAGLKRFWSEQRAVSAWEFAQP